MRAFLPAFLALLASGGSLHAQHSMTGPPSGGAGAGGPAMSSVAATGITGTGATIGWTTGLAGTSQVFYGTTTAYGSSTTLDPTTVTSHSQNLTGLSNPTTYHYKAESQFSGYTVDSTDQTFATSAPETDAWTSGTTATITAKCQEAGVLVEAIGPGGTAAGNNSFGAGGGEYRAQTVSLVGRSSVPIAIGAHAAANLHGTATNWDSGAVIANAGFSSAEASTPSVGGSGGTGTTGFNGGAGNRNGSANGAGAGAGSAGPGGAGGNGGDGSAGGLPSPGGGGGSGAGKTAPGSAGNNASGASPGARQTTPADGGSGGAGGVTTGNAEAGSLAGSAVWTTTQVNNVASVQTFRPGGGGGGAVSNSTTATSGGAGGSPGGAGGGGNVFQPGTNAFGADGAIFITCP